MLVEHAAMTSSGGRSGPAGFEGASCDFGTCRCSGSLSFCEREGICLAPGAYTVARCAGTCGSGLTNCVTACADLQQDPTNCGRCGVECAPEQVCSLGTCATSCSAGLTDCDRSCWDTRVDRAHCGACGIVCEAACVNSECRR